MSKSGVRPLATRVVGVVNVTTDSFSDGGLYLSHAAAIEHAQQLVAEGAHIVDIGGESTRPGAVRVGVDEEQRRVIPIISRLHALGIVVSIDTMNASTARAACVAGATYINDVSGGLADPMMAEVAAEFAPSGVSFIASHWRGHSAGMNQLAHYGDVVDDVVHELQTRAAELVAAGVPADRLVLDPGLGFAKDSDHNWQILQRVDRLQALGHAVLIGASRKRFIGALLPDPALMAERDLPTAVTSALLAQRGVWGVRVHNVAATRLALDVVARMDLQAPRENLRG